MFTDALLNLEDGHTYTSSSPLGVMGPTIPELNALAARGRDTEVNEKVHSKSSKVISDPHGRGEL